MPEYALGHSEVELERLGVQARLVEPITRRFFEAAGVAEGMHVLDVGSGVGDVAFLAAELVGRSGEVVGTDRSAEALRIARRRAHERSLENVTFVEGDTSELTFERSFDAVVGRYVLQFQPDPSAMLRKIVAHARTGGVVVFHEPYRGGVHSHPPVRSYEEAFALVNETVERLGANLSLGLELHSTFVAAGLPAPTLRLEALVASGALSPEHVRYEMDLLPTLWSEMQRLGIAPTDVENAESWVERVLADVAAAESVVLGRAEVGAWSTAGGR